VIDGILREFQTICSVLLPIWFDWL